MGADIWIEDGDVVEVKDHLTVVMDRNIELLAGRRRIMRVQLNEVRRGQETGRKRNNVTVQLGYYH